MHMRIIPVHGIYQHIHRKEGRLCRHKDKLGHFTAKVNLGGYVNHYTCELLISNQGVNMRFNFILCQLFIEKWKSWSKLKVSRENGEIILDIAYWRVYLK